ncbi:MAG: NosD domain-containing protein [Candidatus Asgardarchaeia archaeon]
MKKDQKLKLMSIAVLLSMLSLAIVITTPYIPKFPFSTEGQYTYRFSNGPSQPLVGYDSDISFINTTITLNDTFEVYKPYFAIINTTIIINTTRDKPINFLIHTDHLIIENSKIVPIDFNQAFHEISVSPFSITPLTVLIRNSSLTNGKVRIIISSINMDYMKIENSTFNNTHINVESVFTYSQVDIAINRSNFVSSTLSFYSLKNVNITNSVLVNSLINVYSGNFFLFENLTFYQTKYIDNFFLISASMTYNITVKNNHIFGNGSVVNFDMCKNVTFDENNFYRTSIVFDDYFDSSQYVFRKTNYINNRPLYIYTNINDTYLSSIDAGEIIIVDSKNVTIDKSNVGSIFLLNVSDSAITSSLIESGGIGIYASLVSNLTIEDNAINGMYKGIYITGGSYVSVKGNQLSDIYVGIHVRGYHHDISSNSISSQKSGILLTQINYTLVYGNKIFNAEEGIIIPQDHTVAVNLRIIENDLSNCGFYPFVSLSELSTYQIDNNRINDEPIQVYLNQQSIELQNYFAVELIAFGISDITIENSSIGTMVFSEIKTLTIKNVTTRFSNQYWRFKYGMYITNSENVSIENSSFINVDVGVTVYNSSVAAKFNVFKENEVSVKALAKQHTMHNRLNITYSSIQEASYGIFVDGDAYLFIRESDFIENHYAIFFETDVNGYVFLNNFINNTYDVVSETPLSNLKFNRKFIGNYWSNYNAIDVNKDNIGDKLYILGRTFNDSFPLVNPVHYSEMISDYTILIISDSFILDSNKQLIKYTLNVILNRELLEQCILMYEYKGRNIGIPIVTNITNFEFSALMPLLKINSTIKYWIKFYYNNTWYASSKKTMVFTQNILNVSEPMILSIAFPEEIYENQTINLHVRIFDKLGISRAQILFSVASYSVSKDLQYNSSTDTYYTSFSNVTAGQFKFRIYVENILGIHILTNEYTINVKHVKDEISPNITSIYWIPKRPIKNSTVVIYVNAVDNVGILNVTAHLNTSSRSWVQKLLSYDNGTYCLIIDNTNDIDALSFYVVAYDIDGNSVASKTYTIQFSEYGIETENQSFNLILLVAVASFLVGLSVITIITRVKSRGQKLQVKT